MVFWTAFLIGIFGSLHCIGMCGPIAMAIPIQHNNRWQLLSRALLYNLGRTLTYTLLGILIGLLSQGLFLAGIQKTISIFTGITILLVLLFSINIERKFFTIPLLNRVFVLLKSSLGKFLKKSSPSSIFFTGLLNGLLPCGLVYLALVSALSLETIGQSAVFMLFFGLGTLPLMLGVMFFGKIINLKFRNRLQKLYPFFLLLLGFWFIYRGANFYLPQDFSFWEAMQNIPMCH